MNKNLVKKRFARKLKTYNDNAKIQKQMAEKLLSFLSENEYNSILEIGCGTGILTKYLIDNIQFKTYHANDIVNECEDYIYNLNPNIKFFCGDIENCIKTSCQKYDLIISNAAFQWIQDFPDFIKALALKLNPNGTILFSTFGKENFREINFVLGKSLNYYSEKDLIEILKEFSPIIEEEIRILSFKTPKDVLKHIQKTGVNAISQEIWTKKDLQNFESCYNNLCSNHATLTYNPIYVKIKI